MYKHNLVLFFLLFITGISYSQLITQVRPNRHDKLSFRIQDSIQTDDNTIIVDTTVSWSAGGKNDLTQNNLGKALMTPTGWGTDKGGILFVGVGGTFPQIYTTKSDMIGVVGLSAGDPEKYVGASFVLNINDLSEFNTFSCNVILNRHLSRSSSISVGGIHLFASKLSDSGPSYFIVFSHAVQSIASKEPGAAALHYSIGAGSGRFHTKSPADKQAGRGKYGTVVFGNISYELFKWMNVNAEWSGLNLHAGVSVKPIRNFPYINMGLSDLLRSASNDRVRFVASICYSFRLWK